jgi:aminopeptidase N
MGMKAFGKLAAALACTTALTGAAHAAPYVRQPGIEVEHYVFNVEVADNSHEVKGETVATVRFKSAGVDKVVLELKAKDAKGLGMTVASVTDRAGQPVKFTHTGEALTLQLGAAPKAGEARDFHIRYSGEPEDGLTFGTTRTGGRAFVTWNWPTKIRNWAPTLDHVSSKVTSEWVVTAPETYSVVANGLMQSEVSLGDGRKTTHWRQNVPISPWLNAFMVARFQVFYGGTERGIPLQLWAPVGDKVDVANGMLVQRRTIDFYSDMIGPYPFEKLAGVAAPMMGGAMEHASVVFYGDGGQRDGKPPMANRRGGGEAREPVAFGAYGVMSHEIAHQWFGDSVTEAGWGDVWLSEGFATYFANLYTEHYEGRDAFVKALKSGRTGAINAERKEKDSVITPVDNTEGPKLTQVQYQKGGWVLHMMRQQVTTPVFFKGIQLYYSRHHGAHATTDDLRRAMEDASGQDLKWFFDQWLTRVDSPKLDVKWTYDAGAKALMVTVVQQQAGEAYRLPIEIGVAAEPRGALTVLKMDMDKKTQSFSLPLDKAPVDVVFDPETKLLSETALAQG